MNSILALICLKKLKYFCDYKRKTVTQSIIIETIEMSSLYQFEMAKLALKDITDIPVVPKQLTLEEIFIMQIKKTKQKEYNKNYYKLPK